MNVYMHIYINIYICCLFVFRSIAEEEAHKTRNPRSCIEEVAR